MSQTYFGEELTLFGKDLKVFRPPCSDDYDLGCFTVDGFFLTPTMWDTYVLDYPEKRLVVEAGTIRETEKRMLIKLADWSKGHLGFIAHCVALEREKTAQIQRAKYEYTAYLHWADDALKNRGGEVAKAFPGYSLTRCGWYVCPESGYRELWWRIEGPLVAASQEQEEGASEALHSLQDQMRPWLLPFDVLIEHEFEGSEVILHDTLSLASNEQHQIQDRVLSEIQMKKATKANDAERERDVLRKALVSALASLACETDSDTIDGLLHDAAEQSVNPEQARALLGAVWSEAAVLSGHAEAT